MVCSLDGIAERDDRPDQISELINAIEQTLQRSDLIPADQTWVRDRSGSAREGRKLIILFSR